MRLCLPPRIACPREAVVVVVASAELPVVPGVDSERTSPARQVALTVEVAADALVEAPAQQFGLGQWFHFNTCQCARMRTNTPDAVTVQ